MLNALEPTVPGLGAIQHVILILSVEQLTAHRTTVLDQFALKPIALQTLQLCQPRQIQQTMHQTLLQTRTLLFVPQTAQASVV